MVVGLLFVGLGVLVLVLGLQIRRLHAEDVEFEREHGKPPGPTMGWRENSPAVYFTFAAMFIAGGLARAIAG